MAPNGRAIVVWKQRRQGQRVDLRSSHFSPDTGWSAPQTVGEADDDDTSYGYWTGSDVAINERGDGLVVWHRERGAYSEESQLPRFSVWASRFDPTTGWNTPTALADYDTADAFDPRLTMDAQGRGIAFWEQAEGEPRGLWQRKQRSVWWSRIE